MKIRRGVVGRGLGLGLWLGRPVALVFGVLALVLGAAAVVVSGAPVGASSASSSAKVKAEEAQAKSELLVKSDFPSGWSGQGSVSTDDKSGGAPNFPGGQQLVSCIGIPQSLLAVSTPEAVSPTFQTNGGEVSAQDTVDIAPSVKLAGEANALLASPKVPGCLTTAFQGPARQSIVNSAGNGVTIGNIAVTAANPDQLIRHATGFTVSFPATSQGVTLNVQIDLISVPHGKTDSQLTLTSVSNSFSPSLAKHLETVAYGRT
jgi:hypothetical protein